jgi:hypothetical protein
VKRRPERVKLKNLHFFRDRCQGTAGEDAAGWKSLAGVVVNYELWRLVVAL